MERHRAWVGLAALFGLLAVAAGAFAAHGLRASGDLRAVELVQTGSQYQMAHALAMLGYAALGWPGRLPLVLWAVGIALFAFSLYALAFGAPTAVAMVTPVGGTAMIAGWAALAWQAFRAAR
jgi:uncharacterized membrane protein YgdD (TMEM256/DUF423 family)